MKKTLLVGFATLLMGTNWVAPLASQDITVTPGSRSIADFVTEVSQDLDRQLERVNLSNRYFEGGLAQVRFQIDSDGRAENIVLYRRSGNGVTDRAALQAVRKLETLGTMPASVSSDQVIHANIILARSEVQLDRLQKQLARVEHERMAKADDPAEVPVLALTVTASSSS
jgi:TonB family protein